MRDHDTEAVVAHDRDRHAGFRALHAVQRASQDATHTVGVLNIMPERRLAVLLRLHLVVRVDGQDAVVTANGGLSRGTALFGSAFNRLALRRCFLRALLVVHQSTIRVAQAGRLAVFRFLRLLRRVGFLCRLRFLHFLRVCQRQRLLAAAVESHGAHLMQKLVVVGAYRRLAVL